MKLLATLLALVVALPAHAAGPLIWSGGGQAKGINQNGITLGTSQTLDFDGPANWIKNARARDPVIVGMGLYNDGGATPTDCTGGTPAQLSAPAIVGGEYVVVKSAADAQGEGVYIDITVPANTPSTTAMLELMSRITAGTYTAGDVGVYVYDVTNGGTPQKVFDLGNATSSRVTTGLTWVASSTSTTYRACLHVQTSTSAVGFTLAYDNLYAGIERNGPVPVMPYEGWESFTPTGTWTTFTTYTGIKRRINDSLEMEVNIALGGAPNAANLILNMPSGLTIDANSVTSVIFPVRLIDIGTPSNRQAGYAVVDTPNNRFLIRTSDTNTSVDQTVPFTWASGDSIAIKLSVPIAEWASGAQVSPSPAPFFICDNGSGDVVGEAGCLVPNQAFATGLTTLNVTMPTWAQNYGQADVSLEVSFDGSVGGFAKAADIFPYARGNNSDSSNYYGMRGVRNSGSSYDAIFGNRGVTVSASNASDGSQAWSTRYSAGTRWRVRVTPRGNIVYGNASLNTAGLVSSQYQATTSSTFTFNGTGGGTSSSVDLVYSRIGDWVTLFLPTVQATTGTSSTTLTANTALESWAIPATSTATCALSNIRNNAGNDTSSGQLRVATTTGFLAIRRDGAASAFTNSASAGTQSPTTCTYYVGTGS